MGMKGAAGFFGAVVVALLIGALSLFSISRLNDDAAWVEHTQIVLTSLESLMSGITDAETGQRGYTLTGNESYLEPYHAALDRIANEYARLRQLTATIPQQQQRLDELRPVLDARLATLAQSVTIRRTQGIEAAIRREASTGTGTGTGTGKQLHDHIRLLVKEMTQTEYTLRTERKQRSVRATRYTQLIVILGNLFSMVLIGLSWRQVQRELQQRLKAEQHLLVVNAELADATARAQQSDQLKSAFLATMSHELRTPLNSIIGFSGILRQELAGPLNAEQAKQLDMVQNSARHLLSLINDVLDISKIEAGEMTVAHQSYDLCASLDMALASVTPLAEKKGLRLSTAIPAELNAQLSAMTGDTRRVQQILINLLSNAIKFTQQGSVTLSVAVLPDEQAVRLQVEDTGSGIRPHDLPNLFKPFHQVDTGLSRQHEGTGLGLAICQRLAHLLGGRIEVASVWEQGSTFSFVLPFTSPETP